MYRILLGTLALVLLCAGVVMGVVAIGATRRAESAGKSFSSSQPEPGVRPAAKGDASQWLTQYELTERSGRKFHSDELKGKVHVVNFFFAKCPTACRMQTAAVKALASEFGPKGVVFLSITCDPENDTPVALAQYADEFHADSQHWLFLTGDLSYIRRVGAEVYYMPVDKQTHSESLLLLDRQGKISGRFHWNDAKETAQMKQAMTELLAKSSETPAAP